MIPPIFQTVSSAAGVTALIGASPTRCYPFDLAPQPGTDFYAVPYVVWQIVTGVPENYLSNPPDIDRYTIQFDIYGRTSAEVRAVTDVIRDAIEQKAHIVRWGDESIDRDTGLARYSFDADWHVSR